MSFSVSVMVKNTFVALVADDIDAECEVSRPRSRSFDIAENRRSRPIFRTGAEEPQDLPEQSLQRLATAFSTGVLQPPAKQSATEALPAKVSEPTLKTNLGWSPHDQKKDQTSFESSSTVASDDGIGSAPESPNLTLIRKAPSSNAISSWSEVTDDEEAKFDINAAAKPAQNLFKVLRSGGKQSPQVAVKVLEQQSSGSEKPDKGASGNVQDAVHMQQALEAAVTPEELAEITASVRRNDKGTPTSIGSAAHDNGCRACLFVFTAAGCENGVLCSFCHFKHKRANRPRPCKGKRNRFRQLAARVEQLQTAPEPTATENTCAPLP